MNIVTGSRLLAIAVASTILMIGAPAAAQEDPSADKHPLKDGGYATISGSFVHPDKAFDLDDGYGTNFMIGVRRGFYSIEVGGNYTEFSGTKNSGFSIAGLLFPFDSTGLFILIGGSANRLKQLPVLETNLPERVDSISVASLEGGAGYLLPLNVGRYEFGIRLDARYRYGRREKELNERNEDLPLPRKLEDFAVNLGVQLPLSLRSVQTTTVEPARVVELPEQSTSPAESENLPSPSTVEAPGSALPASDVPPNGTTAP